MWVAIGEHPGCTLRGQRDRTTRISRRKDLQPIGAASRAKHRTPEVWSTGMTSSSWWYYVDSQSGAEPWDTVDVSRIQMLISCPETDLHPAGTLV